jgi:hypothetical protein
MRSIQLKWRVAGACLSGLAVAVAVALGAPTSAPAAPQATGGGVVFGGLTSQRWPVVVEFSRDGRKVVLASVALSLKCGTGGENLGDEYTRLPLSKTGRFHGSYGPVRVDNADGSFDVYTSKVTGASNRARSKLSGTWRLVDAEHNVAGVLTDTCDSGSVHWKAKQ